MSEALQFDEVWLIGENRYRYRFAVGRLGPRWLGFAIGELEDSNRMLFIFPEVGNGAELGLANRNEAIRLTSAVACDAAQGYGGVDRWMIPPRLRGDPEDFRCQRCAGLNCDGSCGDEYSIEDEGP